MIYGTVLCPRIVTDHPNPKEEESCDVAAVAKCHDHKEVFILSSLLGSRPACGETMATMASSINSISEDVLFVKTSLFISNHNSPSTILLFHVKEINFSKQKPFIIYLHNWCDCFIAPFSHAKSY